MTALNRSRQELWLEMTQQLRAEWGALDAAEQAWIDGQVRRLATIQQQLHELVCVQDGEAICRECLGACCGHGCYHPTVATVLAHLVLDVPLPVPDFSGSCPYLGADGCLFPAALRPFNCVTFICDRIESLLSDAERATLQRLEQELRLIYAAFDNRYAGSSLRGLLNRPAAGAIPALLVRKDVLD